MGKRISELPEVTTPLDAAYVPSVQAGVTSRSTWTNIKAFLKTYFDTLYPPVTSGTFTPGITFGGNAVGVTTASASGTYTRHGSRIFFELLLTLSSKGTSVGNVLITGLPVASNSTSSYRASFTIGYSANISYTGFYFCRITNGATTMSLQNSTEAGSVSTMTNSNFADNSIIGISGNYLV